QPPLVSTLFPYTTLFRSGRGGGDMGAQLDAGEREQVVHQPRHAPRLILHDGEKPLASLCIVARRSLQRLDEARQRGKRRAQLVRSEEHTSELQSRENLVC